MVTLSLPRVRELLDAATRSRLVVIGDVMLDHFVWGRVSRISPEAPVPIVDFEREHFMPGGAANVARNLTALGGQAEIIGAIGKDAAGKEIKRLLARQKVGCRGVIALPERPTITKMRIVAGQQQVTRLDREPRGDLEPAATAALLRVIEPAVRSADAVIVGDYGKGVVTQRLLDALTPQCRPLGKWLSLDPKPVHRLNLRGLSLLTPNRKEAFELAGLEDATRRDDPLKDSQLLRVGEKLMEQLEPALLLITLGEAGMLLCRRGEAPFHIPTVAREVFDVSGAGDTVIASFTLAIVAGASPIEAAILSNHAAGVVVGKVGTATVTPAELLASFESDR